MAIIIKDTDEADKRTQRIFEQILNIFQKEKLTFGETLWLLKLLDWELKQQYREKFENQTQKDY